MKIAITMVETIVKMIGGFIGTLVLFGVIGGFQWINTLPDKHEIHVCENMFNMSNGRHVDDHCRRVLAEEAASYEEQNEKNKKMRLAARMKTAHCNRDNGPMVDALNDVIFDDQGFPQFCSGKSNGPASP